MAGERRCDLHDVCEGNALHIRGRDKNGCAQFQDGSWLTKDPDVCREPHPGRSKGIGSADVTRAWLEAEFARGRIRP